jgi:MYXO-CTERM domain-containing protein
VEDKGVPWPEATVKPKYDVGWTPGTDGYLPSGDGATTLSYRTLEGGCGCMMSDRAPPLPMVALIGLLVSLTLIRRRKR